MVRAFMSSFLLRQALFLKEKFVERYGHGWLVWEPGAWTAPAGAIDAKATRVPTAAPATAPVKGDALCFALPAAEATGGAILKVGRDPGCDLVVNDATLSREHFWLKWVAGGWAVEVAPAKLARLGEATLESGNPARLQDGAQVKAGDVAFTFQDGAGMLRRLLKAG